VSACVVFIVRWSRDTCLPGFTGTNAGQSNERWSCAPRRDCDSPSVITIILRCTTLSSRESGAEVVRWCPESRRGELRRVSRAVRLERFVWSVHCRNTAKCVSWVDDRSWPERKGRAGSRLRNKRQRSFLAQTSQPAHAPQHSHTGSTRPLSLLQRSPSPGQSLARNQARPLTPRVSQVLSRQVSSQGQEGSSAS
jgi:hypothetical protein